MDEALGANAWQWDEAGWRSTVEHVRAGRSLKPDVWPGGARVAVALSFDSDHETIELHNGGSSPGRLSKGQYGSASVCLAFSICLRRTTSRRAFLFRLYQRSCMPRSNTRLAIHGWVHERNGGTRRARVDDALCRVLERVCGKRPIATRTPSWDFSHNTLTIIREMGLLLTARELIQAGVPTGIVELPVETMLSDSACFDMVATCLPPLRLRYSRQSLRALTQIAVCFS